MKIMLWRQIRYWLCDRYFPDSKRARRYRAKQFHQSLKRAATALTSGDLVIDCGANIGQFTLLMADTGATVHAFEPHPVAYQVLHEKLKRFDNVHLYQAAVAVESGNGHLFLHESRERGDVLKKTQSSSIVKSKENVSTNDWIPISIVSLPSFFDQVPGVVTLLKMDIEGAEIPILEWLLDTKKIDRVDQLFVEIHDREIGELERGKRIRRRLGSAEVGKTKVVVM